MPRERIGLLAVLDGYRVTGPGRQLLAASLGLRKAGVVTTLAIFQRSAETSPLVNAAREAGLAVVILQDDFPGDPRGLRQLAELARNAEIDLVQTHGYKANVFGHLLARWMRRPWIAFLHGETWENPKVRVYFALERLAVRAADRIVAVSETVARAIVTAGTSADRVRVVHNACLDGVRAEPREPATGRSPTIAVVGRLSPEKGVDVALRAHAEVVRRVPRARLVIAGEGRRQEALVAESKELGIDRSIDWLGYREDLSAVYERSDVLLLPSRSEGLPNVALEAMARGVPVVATAVGGVPEVVVHDRNGLLAPSGDSAGLAAHVVRILEEPELRSRLAKNALDDMRSRFSPEARLKALAVVYDEVLG